MLSLHDITHKHLFFELKTKMENHSVFNNENILFVFVIQGAVYL